MQTLAKWLFGISGMDAAADLRGDVTDFAPGSRNLIPDGVKMSRQFRGLLSAGAGGRKMVQIKDTWGSLDDIGLTHGAGSLFSTVADMLVMIGQGQVRLEGTAVTGAIASSLLKFVLKWNGSYTDPNSGPYTAGLPEPSRPAVGIIDGDLFGAPNLTGTVSIKYARYRKTTGGRSRASETSDVLIVTAKAIYAVAPAIVTGQTHHIFFGTDTKFGGIGLHYRIAKANPFTNDEYREEDVERQCTITSLTGGDKLNAAVGTFSAGDIGKLVEGVSGLTIAAGTTVAEVISSSQVRLSAAVVAGASGVVTLVAYAGGVRRSVVLNWTPSDLTEETAWIYDFPPPSGSHAFQIENRMFVCGYADAQARAQETAASPDSSASTSNPGTALIASIQNQFESYDPRYPIYMPEAVIDVLSDGMEGYKFAGGKNGVYAVQYLNVDNAAPATLTVLLRGEGIQTPGNWCARERAIYLYTGKGQPVRIVEGGVVDKTFAAKIRHEMANIDQADMVVCGHPKGSGVVYAAGVKAWIFDEVTGRWSTTLRLDDQFAGSIVSAVATQSRMVLSKSNSGLQAYYFDEGVGSGYTIGIGQYQNEPEPQKAKMIQRVRAEFQVNAAGPHYVGIHVNTLPCYFEDGVMNAGSNQLTSASADFMAGDLVGSYVLIKGAGVAGGWLYGRIIAVDSPTALRIGTPVADLSLSVALNASTSITGNYVLLAFRLFPVTASRPGTVEVDSQEIQLPGIMSYTASIFSPATALLPSQPLSVSLDGCVDPATGWRQPSAIFG